MDISTEMIHCSTLKTQLVSISRRSISCCEWRISFSSINFSAIFHYSTYLYERIFLLFLISLSLEKLSPSKSPGKREIERIQSELFHGNFESFSLFLNFTFPFSRSNEKRWFFSSGLMLFSVSHPQLFFYTRSEKLGTRDTNYLSSALF